LVALRKSPKKLACSKEGRRHWKKNAAAHELKAAEFEANPTVRPGMEGQPPEKIAAQQAQRAADLRKEAAEYRKQADERREAASILRQKIKNDGN
jgi:hypothetical protein